MTRKKKLAFLFGFTPNLAFAAANAALSLNRHITIQDYDILMYYTDLPESDIRAFKKIPHVVLKQFNLSNDFVDIMLKKMPEGRFKSKNHLMCFAHFEAFSLLNEYETVVWNDVDIGVQGDLADILNYTPLGLCEDIPWTVKDQFTSSIPEYKMNIPAYCSGVMVLNDTLPYQKIYNWLYQKAIQYASYLKNPDQSIINLMLQEFHLLPKIVPLAEYNCISWRDDAITARIVHFGSDQKVWNNTNICNAFPEWYRTHLSWLKLGGSDFDRSKITPRNARGSLDHLDTLQQETPPWRYTKKVIYLFGVLPIYAIKKKCSKTTHLLFSCIPLFKTKSK